MKLIVLLVLVCGAYADYDCLCNYNVEKSVYPSTSSSSAELGFLYEFDCKQTVAAPQQIDGWKSIAFEHKIGFVQLDNDTNVQVCTGDPPTADSLIVVSTLPPQTSTAATEGSTRPVIVTSHRQTTVTEGTTTVPTTTVPTTPSSTPVPTVESTTSPTESTPLPTVQTTPVPTIVSSMAPVSSNNGTHICPQFVYNVTNADNAILIINQVEHKCYEFVQTHETWSTAESNCQKNGGHLVTIRNEKEDNEIFEYVKVYGSNVWLGLNDRDNEKKYTWASGDNSTYINWKSGHNNIFISGTEDCVCMLGDTGHWDDLRCSHTYAYICEYASVPAVDGNIATQPPLDSDGDTRMCPSSAVFAARTDSDIILGQYGDSCYVLTNNSRVTWTSAESQCKQDGGHLAYIRNADEQTFIEDFLYRHYSLKDTWIGLSDSRHEGQFEWSSGEAVTYTNWMSGFNGTHHSNEDCVVMVTQQSGQWDEVYCGSHSTGIFTSSTERHQVLCQYKNQQHHVSSILIG